MDNNEHRRNNGDAVDEITLLKNEISRLREELAKYKRALESAHEQLGANGHILDTDTTAAIRMVELERYVREAKNAAESADVSYQAYQQMLTRALDAEGELAASQQREREALAMLLECNEKSLCVTPNGEPTGLFDVLRIAEHCDDDPDIHAGDVYDPSNPAHRRFVEAWPEDCYELDQSPELRAMLSRAREQEQGCETCGGDGRVIESVNCAGGVHTEIYGTCPDCNGNGFGVREQEVKPCTP